MPSIFQHETISFNRMRCDGGACLSDWVIWDIDEFVSDGDKDVMSLIWKMDVLIAHFTRYCGYTFETQRSVWRTIGRKCNASFSSENQAKCAKIYGQMCEGRVTWSNLS